MSADHKHNSRQIREAILAIVAQVPSGTVATYGQVAELAGFPGRARMVGRTLAESDVEVPWHRIIRSDGEIAPRLFGVEKQVELLRMEGVVVKNGKVDLKTFQLRLTP